jgi:hypothetical protein
MCIRTSHYCCIVGRMSVPALNLRNVKTTEERSSPPPNANAISSRRASHRPQVNIPIPTAAPAADTLFAADPYAISDVATLQQKLADAQKLFLALEKRYERSLEAKQRQLDTITSALSEMTIRDESFDGPGKPTLTATRVGRTDRGVQVGFVSVPSSLSNTPRSTREPTSAHLSRLAGRVTPRGTYVPQSYQPRTFAVGSARALPPPAYTSRATMGSTTTTATGPPMSSPRASTRLGVDAGPSSPFRPYQPATRRLDRAKTPRI